MDTATNGSTCFHTQAKETPAQQILPMIEQRIRDEVEPQVQKEREDMEHVLVLKLEQMGINPNLTNLYSFARGIADKHREQLVGKRIKAIVDGLVSEPTKVDVNAAAMAEASRKAQTTAVTRSVITVTMPPNLTQPQRDAIAANIKAQLPADTLLVSLVGGAELGRV